MSDFLASLAARNLGPPSETPAAEGGSVRPRPAAAFEAEGAGVPPEPLDQHEDIATPVRTENLVVSPTPVAPERPAQPERTYANIADRSDLPEATPISPTVAPDPPAEPQIVAPETPIVQHPEPRPDTEKPILQPKATEAPLSAVATTPEATQSTAAENTEVTSKLKPATPEPPKPPEHDRAAPQIATEPAPMKLSKPVRRVDAPLERIVRQMVLTPRRETRNTDELEARSKHNVYPDRNSKSDLSEEPIEPVPKSTQPIPEPEGDARDIAPLRPRRVVENRTSPLAPVPDLRAPLEPKAAETTIRISIGRIEVKTGVPEQPATDTRPKRPAPKLMSLDEYLETRSSGGGS